MSDPILITVPRDRRYGEVVDLLLGGVASRHLGVDRVDDLCLALEMTAFDDFSHEDLELRLDAGDGLAVEAGPVPDSVARRLAGESGPLALEHVLRALVDEVSVEEREGRTWVRFRQRPAGRP